MSVAIFNSFIIKHLFAQNLVYAIIFLYLFKRLWATVVGTLTIGLPFCLAIIRARERLTAGLYVPLSGEMFLRRRSLRKNNCSRVAACRWVNTSQRRTNFSVSQPKVVSMNLKTWVDRSSGCWLETSAYYPKQQECRFRKNLDSIQWPWIKPNESMKSFENYLNALRVCNAEKDKRRLIYFTSVLFNLVWLSIAITHFRLLW